MRSSLKPLGSILLLAIWRETEGLPSRMVLSPVNGFGSQRRSGFEERPLKHAAVDDDVETAATSLPLQPERSKDLPECSNGRGVDEWAGDKRRIAGAAAIAAFRAGRPHGRIVLDASYDSCVLEDQTDSALPPQLFSIAETPESQMCMDNQDHSLARLPDMPREEFQVSGSLTESFGESRSFMSIWPKDNVCTEQNKCPVVVFFHGCGRYQRFEQMAKYDEKCSNNLRSVMLIPATAKWAETWTGAGTDMLEHFVVPLLDKFKLQYGAVVDENNVIAVGESLGSGMAVQAALLRPDIFTTVVAMGVTDGSSCEDVQHYHPEKLGISQDKVAKKDWKLKLVVAAFAENEANVDERVSGLLGLIDKANATDKVATHFRLMTQIGHAKALEMVQNHWSGFHKAIWEADWS